MERTAEAGLWVGIDVSKDRLDVALHEGGATAEAFAVPRDAAGLEALAARLKPLAPRLVALEATGGFESIAAAGLASAGLPVVVVNPAQVRSFARALGRRAKTDPLDAAVIAHFAAATQPEVRALPDEQAQLLGDLVARRRQIVQMIAAEKQRQKRLTERRLQRSIERLLAALQKELSELDTEIDDQIRGTPVWREKEALLTSVPGIGPAIARTLLAELPELGQLDRRRIASLAGLAPWTRQSGQWRGQSRIGGGRTTVRSALYIGAMVAARYNPPLHAWFERLRAAGKSAQVARIAVARKLLTILNAMLRSATPWTAPACQKEKLA